MTPSSFRQRVYGCKISHNTCHSPQNAFKTIGLIFYFDTSCRERRNGAKVVEVGTGIPKINVCCNMKPLKKYSFTRVRVRLLSPEAKAIKLYRARISIEEW